MEKTEIKKGEYLGECNRTACQNTPATFFNYSTKMFYCRACAMLINQHNHADAHRLYGHDLCVPYGQSTSEI